MDISGKLKEVREGKGLSVEELAEKIGIDAEVIKSWEEGTAMPKASELIELSKTYEMTMDEMLYSDAQAPEYDADNGTYPSTPKITKEKIKKAFKFTKMEKIMLIIFPILCLITFLALGISMGIWNIAWIVFLMIPLYAIVIFVMRIAGDSVDEAVEEMIEENEQHK